MIKKSVSFEDYALAKAGNEDKSYSEIMDIAWKNSRGDSKIKKYFSDVAFVAAIGAVSFIAVKSVTLYSPMPIAGAFEPQDLVTIKEVISSAIKPEHISTFTDKFIETFARLSILGL